jgi:phage terminase small subunit
MAAKLTPKQERFVGEYLIDLNATQAAIRAGYSAKTAEQQGYQLLQIPSVSELIAKGAQKRAEKAEITAQDVLRGLHVEATRTGEGSSHGARVSAWGLLGKYHNLFTDRIDANVNVNVDATDAKEALESLIARQIATRSDKGSAG